MFYFSISPTASVRAITVILESTNSVQTGETKVNVCHFPPRRNMGQYRGGGSRGEAVQSGAAFNLQRSHFDPEGIRWYSGHQSPKCEHQLGTFASCGPAVVMVMVWKTRHTLGIHHEGAGLHGELDGRGVDFYAVRCAARPPARHGTSYAAAGLTKNVLAHRRREYPGERAGAE